MVASILIQTVWFVYLPRIQGCICYSAYILFVVIGRMLFGWRSPSPLPWRFVAVAVASYSASQLHFILASNGWFHKGGYSSCSSGHCNGIAARWFYRRDEYFYDIHINVRVQLEELGLAINRDNRWNTIQRR